MICIICGNPKTNVNNSRPHKKRPSVWRRRTCPICHSTFTTMETVDITDQLSVTSPAGQKSPFSIHRLTVSLAAVMAHRNDAADDAYWLAQTVAEQLYRMETSSLDSAVVAEIAYTVLDRYDGTAAIQYGARHGIVVTPPRRRNIRRGGPSRT